MKYTSRVLSPDEWPRLRETGVEVLQQVRDAAIDGRVLVIEADGQIVASVMVLTCAYVDGLWIDPAKQGNPAIGRALRRSILDELHARGVTAALSVPTNQTVRRWGHVVPGDVMVLDAGGRA